MVTSLNGIIICIRTSVLCLLLLAMAGKPVFSQDQTMIQLKTLDYQLKPYPNLKIALNNGNFHQVNDQGVGFVEIQSDQLPPSTVAVVDNLLEVESWNFSKGILEVVVRMKTYQSIRAVLLDQHDRPMSGITVVYQAKDPIAVTSNAQGVITMNVPISHDLNKSDRFVVKGYQLDQVSFSGTEGTLRILPIPKVTESKEIKQVTSIEKPVTQVSKIEEFDTFNFDYLDSIQSLTLFYAVIKDIDVDELDDELKLRIDEKFYNLVSGWEDSLNVVKQRQFFGSITDSSLVRSDVMMLIDQAMIEQESLERIRGQFDSNIGLLEQKLKVGDELSEEDQQIILDAIARLSSILGENERKFFQNQAQFNNLLEVLKAKLTSIDALEEKLFISEKERVQQSKDFNRKLLTAGLIAFALGLFGIISFTITKKFQRQRNQLALANSEVKRVNEHLEELVSDRTAQLQQTNEELDTFLYKSSHDLRRPLTSIVGLSNIAKMTLKGDASELFSRAADTAKNMDRMLKKLINVNEINNPSHYSPIDFSTQVQKSIEGLNDLIVDQNVDVNSEIQPDIKYTSYPHLIEIILNNLIENAVFFSSVDKNKQGSSVMIDVIQQNGHVKLNLKDNGCGIDPSVQDKIWNMFFVGHEKSEGNGLGLYIARKAVTTLNGNIEYKNDTEGMTIFEVTLPVNGR